MRAAPAVQMPSRDGGLWRATQGLLAALAAIGAAGGAAGWAQLPGVWMLVLLPAVAAGAAWAQAARVLVMQAAVGWDGGCWWLEVAGLPRETGRVRPTIDLGAWMLVYFEPRQGGSGRWLPVARRDAPAAWPAWRAAVAAAACPAGPAGAAAAP